MHTIFTLDFFNQSFFFKQGSQQAFWNDSDQFMLDTTWPFPLEESGIVACETDRNIYHVERPGGRNVAGKESAEILWLEQNIDKFLELAAHQEVARNPQVTLDMVREGNLFATDWVLTRYNEETLLGIPHTITEERLMEVLQYRQQLRDITTMYPINADVNSVVWPINPLA